MKNVGKKAPRPAALTPKGSPSQNEAAGKPVSKRFEKTLLRYGEAPAVCGCDEDTMLAAAGEGGIRVCVMAQNWAVKGGAGPIWGYVEVKPEVVMLARGSDHVPITEARRWPDGKKITFKEEHRVTRGSLCFSTEDTRRFAVENPHPAPEVARAALTAPEPGPRAERNLERTIAVMALLLAKVAPAEFIYAGKPNAEAIAKRLVELLDELRLAESGLSVRAIQERILAALKALAI